MDLETLQNVPVDWNFPSPMATPTHSSFNRSMNDPSICQTPKTVAPLPSHFSDAFTTPQMPNHNTPHLSDYHAARNTPLQMVQPTFGIIQNQFYSSNLQSQPSHHDQSMMFPTAQPSYFVQDPSQAFGHPLFGPVQDQKAMGFAPAHITSPGASMHAPMMSDHPQVQTPPPTRGNSVKRPQKQMEQFIFNTPATMAPHEYTTPQQQFGPLDGSAAPYPKPQHQMSPFSFAHIQFSPNVFHHAPAGPASAPVQQSFSFWDPNNSFLLQQSPHVLDDPFAPAPAPDKFPWAPPILRSNDTRSEAFASSSAQTNPRPVVGLQPMSSSSFEQSTGPTFSPQAASTHSAMSSVDPSLVYTSPAKSLPPNKARTAKGRAPSLQVADAGRRDSGSPVVEKTGTSSPTHVTAPAPRALRRSYTAIPLRSSSEMLSPVDANKTTSLPRTVSPLKRLGKSPLAHAPSSRKLQSRASVILTIDENGLARTETRRTSSASQDRVDETPTTRAARERYPALFDSDSSDAESSDDDDMRSDSATSRKASFSFSSARGDERKSKSAKLDSRNPIVENLEALSILRSSRSSSSVRGSLSLAPSKAAIAAVAQLRRGDSVRKSSVGSVLSASSSLSAPRLTLRRAASSATCAVEHGADVDMDVDTETTSYAPHYPAAGFPASNLGLP